MKTCRIILFAAVVTAGSVALAGSRQSASYSIPAESLDFGGRRTGSTNYTHDGSVGAIGGRSASASGAVVLKSGYVAQVAMNDSPLQVVSAISRKVHGSSGSYAIALPLTAPAGVECRTGGTSGNHQILVTFTTPVTVGGLSITSIDGMASGTRSVSGAVVTVNLTAVANAQILGITLLNVSNGSSTGNIFIPMGVLAGDTTGNGSVTASDIGQVKSQSGATVSGSNFRLDVTANGGTINASDIGLVKSRSGTQLP